MVAEQANSPHADAPAPGADATATGGRMERFTLAAEQIARSRWFQAAAVVLLISLPVLLGLLCGLIWSLPDSVVVATGPEGGFYEAITERLVHEIELQTDNEVDVATIRTDGSLTNLRLLQEGQLDFALYQAGTEELVDGLESCFTLRDDNGDEQLTFEEFISRYPHDVFSELDRDADASLTREEYSAPICRQLKPDVERGKGTFARLDTNDDGLLSLGEYEDTSSIMFVANIVSEAMHVIVGCEASIATMEDLRDRTVALGPKDSGNYAASLMVLEHCGLAQRDRDMQWKFAFDAVDNLDYMQIKERLLEGTLDAALINASTQSPVLKAILGSGKCRLLPVPYGEALAAMNPLVSTYEIPEGIYRGQSRPSAVVPSADVETIALRAQLLTRDDVHNGLVTRVTHIVLNEEFEKEGKLNELFVADNAERRAIACRRPEFLIHRGAMAVYRPIGIDYYRVEKWYALYSFLASACVAGWVVYRWVRRQRARNRVIRLERYVSALFDIERRQLELDVKPNADDVDELRRLSDAVTLLRQRALRDFSSHEVIEDPAVYGFVQICHFVSTKLDAKISRQRLDTRFDELAQSPQPEKPSTGRAKKPTKRKRTTKRSKKA